jgi:predicted TIM-barrel fold metal-dependent hydrolase
VQTADGEVYPLADALADAGVPIIFHSGHIAPTDIAERYPHAQACAKPCPPDRLINMIGCAIEEADLAY